MLERIVGDPEEAQLRLLAAATGAQLWKSGALSDRSKQLAVTSRLPVPDATTLLGMRFRFNGGVDGDTGAIRALRKVAFTHATQDCHRFSAAFVHR